MPDSFEIISTDRRTGRSMIIAHATGESQATDVAETLQALMVDLGSKKIITTRRVPSSDDSQAA